MRNIRFGTELLIHMPWRPQQERELKSSGDSYMGLGTVINVWEIEQFDGFSMF